MDLKTTRINLLNVTDMPYICHEPFASGNFGCGDVLFWKVVMEKDKVIPHSIDLLNDTSTTTVFFPNYGGKMTVADIAQVAFGEIIQPLPKPNDFFEIDPMDGSQWMANIHWVKTHVKNREKYQTALRNWYALNQAKLVWTKSNRFMCGDVGGEHPNKGHYQLSKE